jgi:Domain of unknown function (DUF4190)
MPDELPPPPPENPPWITPGGLPPPPPGWTPPPVPGAPPPYAQAPYMPAPTYGQVPFGQAPYGQAPYAPAMGWTRPPTTDGLAVASLAMAIVGIPFGLLCGIGLLLELAALPVGIVARSRIRNSNGMLTGEGLALAGIIVSGVALVLIVLLIVLLIVSSSLHAGSTGP